MGTATAHLHPDRSRRDRHGGDRKPAPVRNCWRPCNQAPAPCRRGGRSGVLVKDSPDYTNIKVLGDLDVEQFNRLMASITEWVAPVEGDNAGCNYCHNPENMASDEVYTKVVARRMLEMTRSINTAFKPHVGETGVTCYTCHRGQPVPANVWFQDAGPKRATGMLGNNAGQNIPGRNVGLTSMQFDPFTPYLKDATPIRIASGTALPTGNRASIQQTEQSYGLMVHMSEGLGVNCTFCHDSRNFRDWSESTPQRAVSWYGIRMARELNNAYLGPLTSSFPAARLGPLGDVAKVNCATCHQGVNKPMHGAQMVADYPELRPVQALPEAAPAAAPEAAPAAASVVPASAAAAPVAAVTKAGAGSGS